MASSLITFFYLLLSYFNYFIWFFSYYAVNHLVRLDGSGGDEFDKLAINELFEVLVPH